GRTPQLVSSPVTSKPPDVLPQPGTGIALELQTRRSTEAVVNRDRQRVDVMCAPRIRRRGDGHRGRRPLTKRVLLPATNSRCGNRWGPCLRVGSGREGRTGLFRRTAMKI